MLSRFGGTNPTLASSFLALNTPADTTEDLLATLAVPALSINGIIQLDLYWSVTNNANVKNVRVRANNLAGAQITNLNIGNQILFRNNIIIANRGAPVSQFVSSSGGVGGVDAGTAFTTIALDLSLASALAISAQKSVAGDAITLEGYLLQLLAA